MIHPLRFNPSSTAVASGIAITALPLAIVISTRSPMVIGPLLVLVTAAAVVLAEPKAAYLLLPVTVPWGSELTVSFGHLPVTPSDVVIAALLAAYGVQAICLRRYELAWNPWLAALVLLLFAMALSTPEASSLTQSLKEMAKWIEVLVAACLAPAYLKTERDIALVLAITVLAASVEAGFGLLQFMLQLGPKSFDVHHRFLRAYGTFGQPNPMAGYLNMILPIALAVGFMKRNIWYVLAAGLIATASAATLSRSGWAAAILAVVVMASIKWRSWRMGLVILGAAVPIVALLSSFGAIPAGVFAKVFSAFGLTPVNFHHYTKANFSEVERAAHWVAGLRMFSAHPFLGVGIGNYPIVYSRFHVANFTHALGHAHNYFINIAAECGIVGLVAFGLFVVSGVYLCAMTAIRAPKQSLLAPFALGMLGLWASSTFHNLFDVLYVHELPTLIGVLMGLLIAAQSVMIREVGRATPKALKQC